MDRRRRSARYWYPRGFTYNQAFDINNLGQVVGRVRNADATSGRAYIWSENDGYRILGTLTGGNSSSIAMGINDIGQVVGTSTYWGSSVDSSAFMWSEEDGMVDLGSLGGDDSQGFSINNFGQAVGRSDTGDRLDPYGDVYHGFLWDQESGMLDIGTLPERPNSYANSINDTGQVVGTSLIVMTSNEHAFLWSKEDGIHDLGALNDSVSKSEAYSINNKGEVVGISHAGTPLGFSAFLWDSENDIRDLNNLISGETNLELYRARDINDKGQIVGVAYDNVNGNYINGEWRAFLLNPIPTVDDILAFFDESVAGGSLTGDGNGNSANGRLKAFRNMLEMASDLISLGDIEGACGLLNSIIKKCDGFPNPPDFIDGNADTMGALIGMLDDLTTSLECE